MKSRSTAGKSSRALRKPALRLCQACAHQQRVVLRAIRRCLPRAASGFEPGFPGEKLALGGNPFAQLVPAPEDRLMRHLGIGLPALGCCRDEQAVGMIGQLIDQPPLLVCKLGAQRAPSCRLLTLAHGGKLQGENPAELVFRDSDERRGRHRRG